MNVLAMANLDIFNDGPQQIPVGFGSLTNVMESAFYVNRVMVVCNNKVPDSGDGPELRTFYIRAHPSLSPSSTAEFLSDVDMQDGRTYCIFAEPKGSNDYDQSRL